MATSSINELLDENSKLECKFCKRSQTTFKKINRRI